MILDTGIIMNNEMNDFSIPGASDAFGYALYSVNFIQLGKRPLSSMAPVIVEFAGDTGAYLALGAAGGSRIITSVIQSLWNILDRNMTLLGGLESPRFHDQLIPDQVSSSLLSRFISSAHRAP
jgi:gamma-glutamyltranspeptidase/glutathione hydrolase